MYILIEPYIYRHLFMNKCQHFYVIFNHVGLIYLLIYLFYRPIFFYHPLIVYLQWIIYLLRASQPAFLFGIFLLFYLSLEQS